MSFWIFADFQMYVPNVNWNIVDLSFVQSEEYSIHMPAVFSIYSSQ